MKAVNYSWWIGAIISPILTVALMGGSNNDIGILILIGIINGIFWGWIIGLIIDKLRSPTRKVESSISKQPNKSISKAVLRLDGYYVASGNYVESDAQYFVLFFTSKGFAALGELDEFDDSDLSKEEYKQIIAEGENLNEIEVSHQLTKFLKSGEDIAMKFYDPNDSPNIDPIEKIPYDNPVIYNKWSGKIIPNGLLLNLEVSRFNHALKEYEKHHLIHNLKFDFISVGMN